MAGDDWKQIYLNAQVCHLPRYKSDHNPSVLKCDGGHLDELERTRPQCFCLELMWLRHPDFKEVMKNNWVATYRGENIMEQLQQ